jgi:hypothetical protein|tara:strand:- start:124 stop:303 length:180 start_codon:yes stop_codon:yes gene_type:complete
MKIDFKWVVGFLGTVIVGLTSWVLMSVVELKQDTSMIKGELFQIDKTIGRVYNYINDSK